MRLTRLDVDFNEASFIHAIMTTRLFLLHDRRDQPVIVELAFNKLI